jgi:hypothetical protein
MLQILPFLVPANDNWVQPLHNTYFRLASHPLSPVYRISCYKIGKNAQVAALSTFSYYIAYFILHHLVLYSALHIR